MTDVYRTLDRACPRCAARLDERLDHQLTCSRCGGLWLDDSAFQTAVFAMAPDLDLGEPIRFATRATIAPLPCPLCAKRMRPIRFSGVALDRCDEDGAIWLDADELRRMTENVGLEYARRERIRRSDHPLNDVEMLEPQWRPPLEPDRNGLWEMLRRLVGRPIRPEP
jgi:Zn-finger nucleic acid-binding protein